ncbi:hypothetical protein DDN60_12665 [Vibrio cholerae]|nr:hypothetical protein [Vibrio cholerae]
MALSDSDKKKLPYVIGLSLLLLAYGGYSLIQGDNQVSPTINPASNPTQIHPNKSIDDLSLPATPVSLMPMQNINAGSISPQVFEYVDEKGNPVRAIIEPSPEAISTERALTLTNEDMQIISYARSNLLLELQTKNEELKRAKEIAKTPVITSSGAPVVSQSANQFLPEAVSRSAKDLSGFTEMETVQPTFLSQPMTADETEEAFKAIEVASISVGANSPSQVEAIIRVKGKLFKAFKGRRIGDYEIRDVQASHVEIRYVPRNVTQKIGHSGFSE